MDQFFASLPKSVLAFGAIILGFLFIVAKNPPQSDCDAQMDLFHQTQNEFLIPKTVGAIAKPALAKVLFDRCQEGNSPGACLEFLTRLRKMNLDMANLPNHCSANASNDTEMQRWTYAGMKLMSQIAWGDRGPASYAQRYGWFDASDLSLFCGLKKNANRLFGSEAFDQWREGVMMSLPSAAGQARDQIWEKSLFSVSCSDY